MDTHIGHSGHGEVAPTRTKRTRDLSYKFQRLREKVRTAITGGELTGKLPGERILAKRFSCNAKTLSKALTDLAAEGLLERSIGRGTYVKGTAPAASEQGPWLLLCNPAEADSALVKALLSANPKAQVITGEPSSRPSFINQFTAVVDMTGMAPEPFLRDLVVRGIPVVVLGHEPRTYSMDAVIVDRAFGATKLAREMVLAGHRHFVAIEERGRTVVADALRSVVSRYQAENATVDACFVDDLPAALAQGTTAVVCDSCETAEAVMKKIRDMSLDMPGKVSVVAVGTSNGEAPCSGYFVSVAEKTEAVIKLLKDTSPRRPTVMWLAPVQVDKGTLSAAPGAMAALGLSTATMGMRV
jgi:DNA-binding LacI/PurR family transcriptional regulator